MVEALTRWIEGTAVDCQRRLRRLFTLAIELDRFRATDREPGDWAEGLRVHFKLRRVHRSNKHPRHSRPVAEFGSRQPRQSHAQKLYGPEPSVIFAKNETGKQNDLVIVGNECAVLRHYETVIRRAHR